MRTVRFLFAGVIFSSVIFGQQGDPGAAERFRMKFGRSTAAQGESRPVRGETRPGTRTEHKGMQMDGPERLDGAMCDCCHHKHA